MHPLQEQIYSLRNLPPEQKRLSLGGRSFVLDSPIVLEREDSGLVLDGEGAQFFCGMKLEGWIPDGDGCFAAVLPDNADPAAFMVDGEFRPRARYPESGELTYLSTTDVRWTGSTGGGWHRKPTLEELTQLRIDPDTLPEGIRPERAGITVFHQWDESTVRIADYDAESGTLLLESPLEHPAGSFGKSGYVLWGVREGMTRPGQWYVDHVRRVLVYRPMPDEEMSRTDARIPMSLHAFFLDGTEDVTIRNLSVSCCNSHHRKAGLRAADCPGAVEGRGCGRILLDCVNVSFTAGSGIRFTGSHDVEIRNCRIAHCGAGGIFQSETLPAVISGNHISHIGETMYSAVGIHAGGKSQFLFVLDGCRPESGSALILHNTVSDVPYCAIACSGGPHRIEHNRMLRCMTVLHDGAGVYCSRASGTVIRGNFVSGVAPDPASHAYYFDEMSSRSVCEGNVALNVSCVVNNHMSSHCTFRGNAFLCSGDMTFRMPHSDHFLLENNIFAAGGRLLLETCLASNGIQWDVEDVYLLSNNLFWGGSALDYRCVSGYHGNVLYEGPLPASPGVVRLNPCLSYTGDGAPVLGEDSPAHWLGICPPDVSDAGCGTE